MPGLTVRVAGLEATEAALARLRAGVGAAGGAVLRVGSAVEYAPAQEQRRGYLARALGAVRGGIAPRVAAALPRGAGATRDALEGIGQDALAVARPAAPYRTGNLRRSLHHRLSRRGVG